jgi:hypothetical protein
LRPPVCPWRIEVGDSTTGTRSLFLHVFEIVEEQVHQPASITFVPPAGIDIADRWQVRLNATGDLGGTVNNKPVATTIQIESQYRSMGVPPMSTTGVSPVGTDMLLRAHYKQTMPPAHRQ